MSQIIVCRSQKGIVMGADAHALEVDEKGHIHESRIQRLFQLNDHSVLMVGGGPESAAMGAALRSFLTGVPFESVEDVYTAALPFLASEYEAFMQRRCDHLPIDPIHHIYFILAGHSPRNSETPFHAYLIWTKRHLPLLDGDAILSAYAVPRLIQTEVELNRMSRENRNIDEIHTLIRNRIQQGAQSSNRQAHAAFARITTGGITIQTE